MDQCPFCQLIQNKENLMVVGETSEVMAILDINPRTKGHTLVLPKEHISSFEEFKSANSILGFIGKISAKMKEKLKAEGISLVVNEGETAGARVPHLSFQIFPRYEDDLKGVPAGAIFKPVEIKEEELKEIWLKLKLDSPVVSKPEEKVKEKPVEKEERVGEVLDEKEEKDDFYEEVKGKLGETEEKEESSEDSQEEVTEEEDEGQEEKVEPQKPKRKNIWFK